MRFDSLSEAIKYYAKPSNPFADIPPYGQVAIQINQVPSNTNYLQPKEKNVLTYGVSIWGTGKITSVSKPKV